MLSPREHADLVSVLAESTPSALLARLEALSRTHADDPRVWFLLGATRHRAGMLREALEAFDRTLQLAPDHLQALNARGGLLAALGRRDEAREVLEKTRARFPDDPAVLVNLGYLYEQDVSGGQRALECYDAALALDPCNRSALMNRGYLLTLMKRLPEAVENNRQFVQCHPRLAVAHYNHAESLVAAMRPADALAACDSALALEPSLAKAHVLRGIALAELGRLEDSARALDTARSLDPESTRKLAEVFEHSEVMPEPTPDPESIYLHRGLRHLGSCDWSGWQTFIPDFMARVGRKLDQGLPQRDPSFAYYVQATPAPPVLHRRIMEDFAAQFASRAAERPPARRQGRRDADRIRIGYVSPDFREHLNARLTLPIYRLHDRDRFEVACYSVHPDDGSDIRKRVVEAADRFEEVSGLDSVEIAERIQADGIDILVDLAGITTFSRPDIFAFRPAPVQASYLGFPGTLGADYIQYRITDEMATPPGQRAYWRENLVILPDTFYIYDASEALADVAVARGDYGLPETGTVFCAFHNHYKIDPGIFDVWMRILGRVPGSVIWLAGRDHVATENLRREAFARGIEPERLCFAPVESRERYRARFRLADLYLDTRYFTAMTTACDALWAGLPLITSPGEGFTSRVSASLLAAIGLEDCILPDLDAYEHAAVELASDPSRLARLRDRLARNRLTTPLFDTEARVRQLEAAFAEMWRRHLAGLPPASFEVQRPPRPEFRNRWH